MVTSLDNEIWLPVVGYEGLYEVSNMGRIKALYREWYSGKEGCTLRSKEECIISQQNSRGYKRIVLTRGGVQKFKSVHRVVAMAFIPNPEGLPEINHKNGVKSDNQVENFEWVTASTNQLHALELGLKISQKRGEHSGARKISCDTLGISFNCIKDAADTLGVNVTNIWKVCNNRLLHLKGLSFRYI